MNDFIKSDATTLSPIDTSNERKTRKIHSPFRSVTKEEAEKREKYNKNIQNHLPNYKKFIPASSYVLVRVYARKFGSVMGKDLQDYAPKLYISTASGIGEMAPITNPFPFSEKAVVVSTSNSYNPLELKPGDDVYLHTEALQIVSPKKGNKDILMPLHHFIHPDTEQLSNFERPPSDIEDSEFGYLCIPYNLIKGKL